MYLLCRRQHEETLKKIRQDVELDKKFGYHRLSNTKEAQVGWLINMHSVCIRTACRTMHSKGATLSGYLMKSN